MTTIENVFAEYIFTIILMIGEKFIPHYRIRDARKIVDITSKYTENLKPNFSNIFVKWQRKNLNKLQNKMINATLEEISQNSEDEDFQDIFLMMNYIIEHKIHLDILKDLGEKYEYNIEKAETGNLS